jgi:Tfp pilus assembly protein PilZ
MADKRKSRRKIKRRRITFLYENKEYKGISSNFSETGLFIKTKVRFKPGSPVYMVLELDDNQTTALKGDVVRVTERSKFFRSSRVSDNGIGIKLTEVTKEYKEFCDDLFNEES